MFCERSFIATWLISYCVGFLGIDRFYLGKIVTGILKLLTFGGFGIWTLIDVLIVLSGSMKDSQGLLVKGTAQEHRVAWVVTIVLAAISVVVGILTGGVVALMALAAFSA